MTTENGRPLRNDASAPAAPEEAPRPVTYVVLPNSERPFLLARVRWPDVYQAISAVRPDWQDDPGLFDLPYAPSSEHVSYAEAVEIAEEWGARIPSEEVSRRAGPSLIRRMPSDWSSLSTAERRAWSIEIEKPDRRALATAAAAAMDRAAGPEVAPSAAPLPPVTQTRRRRWWRRAQPPLTIPSAAEAAPMNAATARRKPSSSTSPKRPRLDSAVDFA